MAKKNIWTGEGYFWGDDEKDPYGTLNPEQRMVNQGLGKTIMSDVSRPAESYRYTGQLTEPITRGEEDVVSNAARLNALAGNTFSRLGTYDPQQVNADFETYVQNPTFSKFKSEIEPYLAQELPSFGTQRAQVVARNMASLGNDLATQRMTYQQQAKDTALNALSGANTYNQGAAAIQAVPRMIRQAGLDREYADFITANQQKADSLNRALQFLGISTGTVEQKPSLSEFLITLLKSGAQIAAAGA